jgi:hypothetical protein
MCLVILLIVSLEIIINSVENYEFKDDTISNSKKKEVATANYMFYMNELVTS